MWLERRGQQLRVVSWKLGKMRFENGRVNSAEATERARRKALKSVDGM